MKKSKIVGAIIGIVLFVAAIAGLTYAYTIWSSENINRKVSSKCFNVLYDKGNDLSGAIIPSYDYTGGLSTTVRMNMDVKCNVNAKGRLYLVTSEDTSSNLFRTGLLNYVVLRNGTTVIAEGNITSIGEIAIDLGKISNSESAFTRYEVYVWIDYNLVENSDVNSVYYGKIRAEAIQEEGEFGTVKNIATDYITNLYLSNRNKIVTNNNIEYQYAESVNLMNDRLGGTTEYYDEGNIRYYGANPNNYVDIGDRDSSGNVILYRIIGLFKDMRVVNDDGTTELQDLIKVIRETSIGYYPLDNKTNGIGSSLSDSGSNDWSDSRLMMILNPGYDKYNQDNPLLDDDGNIIYGYKGSLWWNSENGTCYFGDSNSTRPCNFKSTGLSSQAQNKVETVEWNLGGILNPYVVNEYYEQERGTTVYTGRPIKWIGKVALMYASDYGYATDFMECTKTLSDYSSSDNSYGCRSNDWLYNADDQWLLDFGASSFNSARPVIASGKVRDWYAVDYWYGVRPTFYLNSELVIESGEGTMEEPYVLG